MTILPVVLSGGAGSRLWPVSRALYPKPFLRLPDGRTLLCAAFDRAGALKGTRDLLLVTNREYAPQCQDEFTASRVGCELHAILEPTGRNTAPAIAMAAWFARERFGGETVLLAIAADHLIVPQEAFQSDVDAAAALAREGWIATFGIRPSYPETGFGYIEIDRDRPIGGGFATRKFKEKPPAELAVSYMLDGAHYWNSGIFCMRADLYLAELETHQPALAAGAAAAWQAARERRDWLDPAARSIELIPDSFNGLADISVDYAVIERSNRVAMVPATFEWSDIGSWRAVSELIAPDTEGNRLVGRAMALDTRNTFIQSGHRLTAAVGVDELLIVDTEDALLVAHNSRAQDVKLITDRLRAENHEAQKLHRTVHRPWGSFTVLEDSAHHKIKRLSIKPGGCLSLQMHAHRSEHWVVVEGEARVTRDEEIIRLGRSQSTHIPAGTKHRLENLGTEPLIVIEVQTGRYLGEDDIVRLEDRYGRSSEGR